MAGKKSGLGRGLDSLFVESAQSTLSAPTTLRISDIEPDKEQPRQNFDQESLSELAASIAEHGVLQPLVVRPTPQGSWRIVAGERRWRAARLAGLAEVPAVIKEVSDSEAMEIALIENLQREDLDPMEEAAGYRQLIDRCGYTQEQAAQRLGKSRTAVTNSLRLLGLEESVRQLVSQGSLSGGHAKALLALEGADQRNAAQIVVAQGLNVRQTEQLCKKLKRGAKPAKAAPPRPALAGEVELALREALGTEVHVKYKEGRGSLQVDFYSDEQLRAFANLLGEYANAPLPAATAGAE